ncbi:hypothetical protein ACIBL6_11440 [Streptomyces sp. NPDC050400]|uniref:hypothetical protein n=1 Tax=Streptomyces sp. NPDC050400 TaxID=3365610 RepID=UPI00378A9253
MRSPTENVPHPIYDDLVREFGDVVAEAQVAAEFMQHQAVRLLGAPYEAQPARHGTLP